MLRFRWITFDRFKVVNLSRFYRVNFIRPYWVNFTVFSMKATKKFSMLLSLKIKQIGANAAGAPHKKSKKKLQTKKNVIPLHSQ